MTTNTSGERFLIASFGGNAFLLAGIYVFLEFLVIRNFPKHQKIRRILFNSDFYFKDSTSNEYFGWSRTIQKRRNKATFKVVTAFADVEKRTGEEKPILYTVYSALTLLMAVLGIFDLITMPLVFENGTAFSNMSQNVFYFAAYLSPLFVLI